MTTLPTHTQRDIRNAALSALHCIAYHEKCEVSDILALLIPSQPKPAVEPAQADEPVVTSAVEPEGRESPTGGEGGDNVLPAFIPSRAPSLHISDLPEGGKSEVAAVEPSAETVDPVTLIDPIASTAAEALTQREKVRRCHLDHPDYPAKKIAEDTGIGEDRVRAIASQLRIKLPNWWGYVKDQQAKTAAALRASSAVQAEAKPAPEAHKPQPAHLPSPDANAGPPRSTLSSSVRFYVVDAKGRYVHQSLDPSPTGTGPLMTEKRIYAWFPNEQQFRNAVKKWPELEGMRREVPVK